MSDAYAFGDTETTESDVSSQSEAPVDSSQPSTDDLSLASPFLSKIPVQDRAVVARYIKEWDAGVTKKFQEYSGKLKPYETLGQPEELQRYVNFANQVRQDPETVFRLMYESLANQHGENFEQELFRILQLEQAMSDNEQYYAGDGETEYQGQPDPNQVFQQNVSTELEEMRAWKQEMENQRQAAEEKAQLDGVLQMMHNKFGEFDNDWILQRLATHGKVDQAMQEWNAMLSQYTRQGTQRQAPKVMGGHGGVPNEQVDTSKLKGADRKAAVLALMNGMAGD